MDYRFLVHKNLREWEKALVTGRVGTCHFCDAFEGCGGCPMLIDASRGCTEMVLNGRTWNEGMDHRDYIVGCIAFYVEWLRTGIMPKVEYRGG